MDDAAQGLFDGQPFQAKHAARKHLRASTVIAIPLRGAHSAPIWIFPDNSMGEGANIYYLPIIWL